MRHPPVGTLLADVGVRDAEKKVFVSDIPLRR
jgi:hypothetical protein